MTDLKTTQTKWQLQIIFLYYASFADRNNYKFLKQQNYRRFLIDSETVTHERQFPYFDIQFRKMDKSAIHFVQFLQMIPNLSQMSFKKQSRKQAFKYYMLHKMQPLYLDILKKSEFGEEITSFIRPHIQQKTVQFLQQLPPMHRIYQDYILSTSMHQKTPLDTYEQIYIFLKDFELAPQIVYRGLCYAIFLYLLKSKQDSSKFSYQDFIELLIRIAQVGSKKTMSENMSQAIKVIKILQRMEISEGFKKISKKMARQSHLPTFFTPTIRQIFKLQMEKNGQTQLMNFSKQQHSSAKHKYCSSKEYIPKKKDRDYKKSNFETVKSIMQDQSNFGRDLREVKILFEQLCSYGQVGNIKTLKSIKIKKLFEQAGLVKNLTQAWLDIRISNLCSQSESGKIQFAHFLELINLTAVQLGTTFESIIKLICQINYARQENHRSIDKYSKISMQHDHSQIYEILQLVQKPLEKIFKFYSKGKPYSTFQQISKLMYDFEVFPQMVCKIRLHQIFQQNIEQRKHDNELAQLTQQPLLSFKGLQDLLAKIAFQINELSLSQGQKIIVLLQKMHQSKGQKKVVMNKGSLVSDLRNKYAHIYSESFSTGSKKNQKQHVQNFQELVISL